MAFTSPAQRDGIRMMPIWINERFDEKCAIRIKENGEDYRPGEEVWELYANDDSWVIRIHLVMGGIVRIAMRNVNPLYLYPVIERLVAYNLVPCGIETENY